MFRPRRTMHFRARTDSDSSEIGRSRIACSSRRDGAEVDRSLGRRLLVNELADLEAPALHHLPDFDQRRLAEILARHGEPLLGDLGQVAQRADAHLLQAVARADGELEIGDGDAEHLRELVAALLGLLVVVHVRGGQHVLHVELGTRVVLDIEDPLVADLRLLVLLAVLVQDAEVEQHADVRREALGRLLVELERRLVVAAAFVLRAARPNSAPTWVGSFWTARSKRATTSCGLPLIDATVAPRW